MPSLSRRSRHAGAIDTSPAASPESAAGMTLDDRLMALGDENASLRDRNADLEAEIERLKLVHGSLKSKATAESQSMEASLQSHELQLQVLQDDLDALRRDHRALGRERDALMERCVRAERNWEEATRKEGEQVEVIRKLRGEIRSLKKKEGEREDGAVDREEGEDERIEELRRAVAEAERKASGWAKELAQHKQAKYDLQAQVTASDLELHTLRRERDELLVLNGTLMEDAESYQVLLEQRMMRGEYPFTSRAEARNMLRRDSDATSADETLSADGDAEEEHWEVREAPLTLDEQLGGLGRKGGSLFDELASPTASATTTAAATSSPEPEKESDAAKNDAASAARVAELEEEVKALTMFIGRLTERICAQEERRVDEEAIVIEKSSAKVSTSPKPGKGRRRWVDYARAIGGKVEEAQQTSDAAEAAEEAKVDGWLRERRASTAPSSPTSSTTAGSTDLGEQEGDKINEKANKANTTGSATPGIRSAILNGLRRRLSGVGWGIKAVPATVAEVKAVDEKADAGSQEESGSEYTYETDTDVSEEAGEVEEKGVPALEGSHEVLMESI
ncbi:hypothetical protein HK101_008884 [Irineochytrium annulatum]|nr:hypothetical protein HK101_008884 [Irineochytrium annulatum]